MTSRTPRDRELHARLQAAFQRDLISVYVDFDKLQSPKSPIFDPWLAVGPLLGLLLLSLTLLLAGGMIIGTAAMVVAVLVYVMVLRPWLEQVFRQKAIHALILDLRSFLILWEYGGVGLSLVERPETMVAAPGGHWRHFVVRHLPNPEAGSIDPELASVFAHDAPQDDSPAPAPYIPGEPLEGEILSRRDSDKR